MFILVKGSEQVSLRDEDSARMLAYALSDYNCEDAIKRKIIISNTTGTFFVIICVVAEKCNKE